MAYLATNIFPADGVKTSWDFAFAGVNPDTGSGTTPYLYAADVKALELYRDVDGNALSAPRLVYIDPAQPLRAHIVGSPVAAGRQIKIYRSTEIRFPLVDYRDRQSVSEFDLDLANRQSIFVAQETQDAASNNMALDRNDNYDVLNRRIVNLAPGIDPTDAINLSQLTVAMGRALRTVASESVTELPLVAARAGKFLSFDALGNPVATSPSPGTALALEQELATPIGAGKIGATYGVTTTVQGALDAIGAEQSAQDNALIAYKNDIATKGSSLIFGAIQTVATVADLRLLLKSSVSQVAQTLGYFAKGDGGASMYFLHVADTTSLDNGSSVIVAADGGRWKLSLSVPLRLEQAGATGNGITDDHAAIQRALDAGIPDLVGRSTAIYRITDTLVMKTNKQTLCLNKGEFLLDDPTGLLSLIKIGAQVTQVGGVDLNKITFTRAQAATAGYAVDFSKVGVCTMRGCRVYGNNRFWRGVRIDRGIIIGLLDNYIDNCVDRGVYLIGTGMGADRTVDVTMRGNRIEGGNVALETSNYVEGLFARGNIFFNTNGISVILDADTNAQGLVSFKLQHNDYDTCGGGGLYIDKVSNVQITGCWFSAVQNFALTIGAQADGVVVNGNQLYPAQKGIINGGNDVILSANLISGGSNAIELGAGSNHSNTNGNTISNCTIGIVLGNAPNAYVDNNVGHNISSGLFSGVAGAGSQISANKGDTVRGTGNFITVGASPFTYTAGARPEYISIFSGTVSEIRLGSNAVGFTTNRDVTLAPGQSVVVTYSTIPLMVKNFL